MDACNLEECFQERVGCIKEGQKSFLDQYGNFKNKKQREAASGWETELGEFLAILRSYDLTENQPVDDFFRLLNLADSLCRHGETPALVQARISEFISFKIALITDIFKNRDYRNSIFSRRSELPKSNRFRTLFVSRYIQWQIYHTFLAPLNEGQGFGCPLWWVHSSFMVQDEWMGYFRQLAEFYEENDLPDPREELESPFCLTKKARLAHAGLEEER